MKVIDLLNIWVKDRSKLPEKIKIDNEIFEYDRYCNLYKNSGTECYLIQNYLNCVEKLNKEVEAIEEKEEIDTINAYKLIEAPYLADCLKEKKFDEVAELLKQSELEIVERVNNLVYAVKNQTKKERKDKMGSDFDDDFSRILARNNMELRDEIMKYVEERFINKKKIEEVIEKSKDFYDKEEVTNLLIDLLYE